jgi:hypothetical protein
MDGAAVSLLHVASAAPTQVARYKHRAVARLLQEGPSYSKKDLMGYLKVGMTTQQ